MTLFGGLKKATRHRYPYLRFNFERGYRTKNGTGQKNYRGVQENAKRGGREPFPTIYLFGLRQAWSSISETQTSSSIRVGECLRVNAYSFHDTPLLTHVPNHHQWLLLLNVCTRDCTPRAFHRKNVTNMSSHCGRSSRLA